MLRLPLKFRIVDYYLYSKKRYRDHWLLTSASSSDIFIVKIEMKKLEDQ
jgi:hypothetical protein